MSDQSKWVGGGVVVLALVAGTLAYASTSKSRRAPEASLTEAAKSVRSSAKRPAASRSILQMDEKLEATPKSDAPDLVDRLDPASSPQVAEVFDAINSGEAPELTGPMIPAPAFDLESYQQNPEAYLSRVVPGRVWQSAQPSADTPRLATQSSLRHAMKKGESIRLQLLTDPEMPVSFMATDLGTFSNGLGSITVAANSDGLAEAIFTASSGSARSTKVLAASPVTSGRVRFDISISQ